MSGPGTIWTLSIVGPVILALIIIYALLNQRRLSRRVEIHQDEAVNNLYEDPQGRSSPAGAVRAQEAEIRLRQK